MDLREKIVALYDSGGITQRQLAARFCVSVFFVKKLFRHHKQTGNIALKQRHGSQRSRLSVEMRERLIDFHQEKNDLTIDSHRYESSPRIAGSRAGETLNASPSGKRGAPRDYSSTRILRADRLWWD